MRFVVVAIKAFGNFTISSNGFFLGGGLYLRFQNIYLGYFCFLGRLFGLLLRCRGLFWLPLRFPTFVWATFACAGHLFGLLLSIAKFGLLLPIEEFGLLLTLLGVLLGYFCALNNVYTARFTISHK